MAQDPSMATPRNSQPPAAMGFRVRTQAMGSALRAARCCARSSALALFWAAVFACGASQNRCCSSGLWAAPLGGSHTAISATIRRAQLLLRVMLHILTELEPEHREVERPSAQSGGVSRIEATAAFMLPRF